MIVVMTIWREAIERSVGPRYLAVADAIAENIKNGQLRPGDRLPAQRDLAGDLGVSLNTITRAYAEATRWGFLEGEVGRGTFVRSAAPPESDSFRAAMIRDRTGPIDFSLNLPITGSAGMELATTLGELSRSPNLSALVDDQTEAERQRHLSAGGTWIEQLGLDASGRSVILCNGAQHGIFITLLALTKPGDVLLAEELTYAPVLSIARQLGLRVWPIALDDDGLVPDALDAACRTTAARVLYCMPTLHTPTAVTMSERRRRDIAHIAIAHEMTVIEDDVFGFLPLDRPAPLACFAPARTIYATGTSKSMAPGLRVGYLSAPEPLAAPLNYAAALTARMPPPLMAEIAARWIEDGTAGRLNDEKRTEAAARRQMALAILGDRTISGDSAGYHLWLTLPDHWQAGDFWAAAKQQGVEVQAASAFAVDRVHAPDAIRLCLSHEPTRDRVAQGLRIIANLLESRGDERALVV